MFRGAKREEQVLEGPQTSASDSPRFNSAGSPDIIKHPGERWLYGQYQRNKLDFNGLYH